MLTYSCVRSQVTTRARPAPRPKWITIVYSRSLIAACVATSSNAAARTPYSNTGSPPIVINTCAGSNATPARPAAASSRPQFGSALDHAVLHSGEVAIVFAIAVASSLDAAPEISSVTTCVTPSPSSTILYASASQTRCSAASNSGTASPCAATPLLPLASRSTVSLVLMSPSIERQSKLDFPAAASIAVRCSLQAARSVNRYTSIVACGTSCGPIIPAPFAQPNRFTVFPSISKLSCATFSFVSVVKIAVANASALSAPSPSAAFATGTAATSFSTGNGTPIIPVDDGKISSNTHPIASATATQLLWQASMPGSPVAQLAFPAFTTTAETLPPVAAKCLRPTIIGAATTWLLVYITPASAGPSQTASARSGLPLALIPAL